MIVAIVIEGNLSVEQIGQSYDAHRQRHERRLSWVEADRDTAKMKVEAYKGRYGRSARG